MLTVRLATIGPLWTAVAPGKHRTAVADSGAHSSWTLASSVNSDVQSAAEPATTARRGFLTWARGRLIPFCLQHHRRGGWPWQSRIISACMQLVSMARTTIVQAFWCNECGRHFLCLAWPGSRWKDCSLKKSSPGMGDKITLHISAISISPKCSADFFESMLSSLHLDPACMAKGLVSLQPNP